MKNTHITPNSLVPEKIRYEVYKEVYDKLISGELSNTSEYPNGLCRYLPLTLWGIELHEPAPNGEKWYLDEVLNMFPELNLELSRLDRHGDYFTPRQRLDFLLRQKLEEGITDDSVSVDMYEIWFEVTEK